MSVLDKLTDVMQSMLTTSVELKRLEGVLIETRQEVKRLDQEVQQVRDRVTRLEASRDADRAQLAAEISRFKLEMERAETKLSKFLPAPTDPPSEEKK